MAARGASLRHPDLATYPGTGPLDRLTRAQVLRLSCLEEVQDVLRTGGRPQGQELVIRIDERPTAADGDEARVALFGKDYATPFMILPARHLL